MNKVQLLVVAEAAAAIIAISAIKKKKLLSRRNRKIWSKKWFLKNKEKKSVLGLLNEELSIEDVESYKNFLRMTEDQFNLLLTLIKADIEKETTNMRDPISAKHRLQITLRFLATGESFRSLMYSTRVHETTISQIVMEVCCALNNRLRETYLKTPNSKEVVENAFGILANRFRVLLNPIHLNVNKVETITFTCILLHNFLTKDVESTHLNLAEYEVEGCSLLQIHQQGGNRSSNVARETRDIFKKFFNDMGAVTWQEDEINKSNM